MAKKKTKITIPFVDQCIAAGLMEPVEEYCFAPPRRWRFDFAWPEKKVALEKEGGIYGIGKPCPCCKRRKVGAHTSIQRLKSDMEKYSEAAILGWAVLRSTPKEIESGEAIVNVIRALEARKES